MKKILITAIILVYHNENYLEKCISSIRLSAETANVDLEIIIVVDDPEFTKANFRFPSNCIVIFNKQNLGYSKSNNIAIKKAKGKWLLILNGDILSNKLTLMKLLKRINDTQIAIIAPKITYPDGKLQYTISEKQNLWNIFKEQTYLYKLLPFIFRSPQSNRSLYIYPHEVDSVAGAYFLIRKDIFIKIGGFDERYKFYFEDIDLCQRIRNLGYKIFFESDTQIIHFKHQSFGGIKNGQLFMESLKKYCQDWYSSHVSWMIVKLVLFGSLIRLIYWHIRKYANQDRKNKDKILNKIHQYQSIFTAEHL